MNSPKSLVLSVYVACAVLLLCASCVEESNSSCDPEADEYCYCHYDGDVHSSCQPSRDADCVCGSEFYYDDEPTRRAYCDKSASVESGLRERDPLSFWSEFSEVYLVSDCYNTLWEDDLYIFKEYSWSVTIYNRSKKPVVLNSIELTPDGQTLSDEWQLLDLSSGGELPLVVRDETIAPGETFTVPVFFQPQGYGKRAARLTVRYNDNQEKSFFLDAQVSNLEVFRDNSATTLEQIWGNPLKGEMFIGGMVNDAEGSMFVSANVKGWLDGSSENLALAKLSRTGGLLWAREWNERFEQLAPDPGQSGESGGGADSIAIDANGDIYLVGRRSLSQLNMSFQTLVIKVDGETGEVVWTKGWTPTPEAEPLTAVESSAGYAVKVEGDRVLVVGATAGDQHLLVLGLSSVDGSVLYNKAIEVVPDVDDRAYSLALDGQGGAYIGGLANANGLLLHISGVDGDEPTLDWVRLLTMEPGSNVNSLDVDAAGNAYLALDRRGAETYFSAARFNLAGELSWAKTWGRSELNTNNNTHVVRVHEDGVYVGGRVAFAPFDTALGDGFIMKLAAEDAAYDWGTFYYTGNGETLHRVKGMTFDEGSLQVLMESYTEPSSFGYSLGRWYIPTDFAPTYPVSDGAMRLMDYPLMVAPLESARVMDVPNGTAHAIDASNIWREPAEGMTVEELRTRRNNGSERAATLTTFILP